MLDFLNIKKCMRFCKKLKTHTKTYLHSLLHRPWMITNLLYHSLLIFRQRVGPRRPPKAIALSGFALGLYFTEALPVTE